MSRLMVESLEHDGGSVTFDAESGEIVALLGTPGSGGDHLLTIAGLHTPHSGSVLLDGTPVTPGRVGLMARRAVLFPELTSAENVAVALLARGLRADPARIDRVLSALALDPAGRGNLVEQLSGGQQQRVALARALVTESALVCLDEPVTELDRSSAEAVWGVFRQTADRGAIILIATTDHELAARCDRLVSLDSSRRNAAGPGPERSMTRRPKR